MLGRALSRKLRAAGHKVIGLSRRKAGSGSTAFWDPEQGVIELPEGQALDAVIHLAGENIADGRWSDAKKERVVQSRVASTRLLVEHLVAMPTPPKVIISASGIGYYGETGDESVDESSPSGDLFISEVCRDWEHASMLATDAGIRVVHARLGMVISGEGGALVKMLPAFKLGLGGVVGSGRQWMSWIGLNDVVGLLELMLEDERLMGAVNLVAPEPSTNREFTHVLARVLKRPALVPMPVFLVKLLFGQMGEELLLASCRVSPQVVLDSGYDYCHRSLEAALTAAVAGEM